MITDFVIMFSPQDRLRRREMAEFFEGRMEVDDELDRDNELGFEIFYCDDTAYFWLDKTTAIELIEHIKKAFNL